MHSVLEPRPDIRNDWGKYETSSSLLSLNREQKIHWEDVHQITVREDQNEDFSIFWAIWVINDFNVGKRISIIDWTYKLETRFE